MDKMILIASSAYVDDDLSAEVGLLPPAFLPVGNRRLFSYQLDFLKKTCGEIYLSIPNSFVVDPFDQQLLARQDVSVLRVPDNLSLGNTVLYCWNATGKNFDELSILYGDTLLINIDLEAKDVVAIHPLTGSGQRRTQSRGEIEKGFFNSWPDQDGMEISGYFCLSTPRLLMKGIVQSGGNFMEGLRYYANNVPLREVSSHQCLGFGHLNSFFRSRTVVTTQRAFNEMSISSRKVVKISSNVRKMIGEAYWFERIPPALRIHTPALLRKPDPQCENSASYELEYLYLPPLSDLFVYGSLTEEDMEDILQAANAVLTDFARFKPHAEEIDYSIFDRLYLPKTVDRLISFSQQHNLDLEKNFLMYDEKSSLISIMQMAVDSAGFIAPTSRDWISVSHGDFCFSNILFDRKSRSIKVIDPRGVDESNNPTIYGDRRYDVAKLYHSVVGLYDFLIAGRYELIKSDDSKVLEIIFAPSDRVVSAERLFSKLFFETGQYSEREILAITVHLFLSMLPLHYDRPDRQDAMLANALRLFRKLNEGFKAGIEDETDDRDSNGRIIQPF